MGRAEDEAAIIAGTVISSPEPRASGGGAESNGEA